MNTVIETYSRLASQYDDPENIDSCWGAVTRHSLDHLVTLHEKHKVVVDVGCGVGRELAKLASCHSPKTKYIGIEPAARMRELAMARTAPLANVQILDGSFEHLPLENASVDYLYSILGFHWTTNLEKSVTELARVLKATGEMDLIFIGRNNGREFIQSTTPVFMRYMTPAMLVQAALLRKQLTVEAAQTLFRNVFGARRLTVTESYQTYYDTLDGHWSWWVRIEGQLVNIPESVRIDCDQLVKAAIAKLATDKGIPYTVHLLHVSLRDV
jgi:ubiquinone/menaquinone biosynthesis C-methylase UbiE